MKCPGPALHRDRAMVESARALALVVVVAVAAILLQGCDVPIVEGYIGPGDVGIISTHEIAFWRSQKDYFTKFSYRDPFSGAPRFNSCADPRIDGIDACSGHGVCTPFDPDDIEHPIRFCKCDKEWGGVECGIRRRRQSFVFLLSLLLGPIGLDELYLGFPENAISKLLVTVTAALLSVTGKTKWAVVLVLGPWIFDVVRLGTVPVRSHGFRLVPDLPRCAFALATLLYLSFWAVAVGVASLHYTVLRRRHRSDEEACYHTIQGSDYIGRKIGGILA